MGILLGVQKIRMPGEMRIVEAGLHNMLKENEDSIGDQARSLSYYILERDLT